MILIKLRDNACPTCLDHLVGSDTNRNYPVRVVVIQGGQGKYSQYNCSVQTLFLKMTLINFPDHVHPTYLDHVG